VEEDETLTGNAWARSRTPRLVGWMLAACAIAGAAGLLAAPPGAWAENELPHVSLIGDSTMTAVIWETNPLEILTDGLDLLIDVEVCRSLAGVSCPYEGRRPPNLVDTVHTYGARLGPTTVVVAGSNEPETDFAAAVEASLQALRAAGVQRVLWTTLSEATPSFGRMNAMLREAARHHPELTVVDWNAVSADHNDWFQTDHVHLTYAGGVGLARLLRTAIGAALDPPAAKPDAQASAPPLEVVKPRAASLRAAPGTRYSLALRARGGVPPYRWAIASGRTPRGLSLTPTGRITGTPIATGRTGLAVRVRDALGSTATLHLTIDLR
jgi:hypothetical protein